MIRTILFTALVLGIALGGGISSAWYAVDAEEGLGASNVGGWVASPTYGTPSADPYSKARFARAPELVLGAAEGLVFRARRDASGQPLTTDCQYRIDGLFPAARFWTIHLRNERGELLAPLSDGRVPALHSRALLRAGNGSALITIGRNPAPGNWLAVSGADPFVVVLTLYDTAIASSARIEEVRIPPLERTGCDA
jgi:hypothetical protein